MRSSLLKILTFLGSLALSMPGAWASSLRNICENPAARQVIMRADSFQSFNRLREHARKAQVILIGETHFTQFGNRKHVMNEIAQGLSGRVCLMYELDRESSVQEHLKSYDLDPESFDFEKKQIGELHDAATRLGWREFTVDLADGGQDISVGRSNVRDEAMASRMAQLLSSGCERAVMFVGKIHLHNQAPGRRHLSERLKDRGLRVLTTALVDPSDERMRKWGREESRDNMSWNGVCAPGRLLPKPSEAVLFFSSRLPPGMRLYPLSRDLGLWSAYDLTLLIPDPTFH